MNTWHLHIRGRVQGVGFRPHVWRQARAMGLRGEVCNTTDGVHVWFEADEGTGRRFAERLAEKAPPLARVLDWQLKPAERALPPDFRIVESRNEVPPDLVLTPDAALCAECRAELRLPENRRRGYAFITCTHCGPRYSIIEALPYDRPRTTMAPLAMCAACAAEYDDPADRRYFSQTNSCPDCPVPLFLWENGKRRRQPEVEAAALIDRVCALWRAGGIVAVKGIGGYLLTCDAGQPEAVRLLRKRKQRPDKPLALMAPDLAQARHLVQLDSEAERWLQRPEAPIVVAPATDEARHSLPLHLIAPALDELGVMIPYAPLFEWLLARFGKPVIATSGNLSGAPVVYDDDRAIEALGPLCEAVLGYERRIVTPQDDSVLRLAAKGRPIWLRRSRGLAPSLLLERPLGTQAILAMGARMKSAFAIQVRGRLYQSQYLGDTDSYEAWCSYRHTLNHLCRLLHFEPEVVLVDAHPEFANTRLGRELAHKHDIPLYAVPHHEAHFAAVLAEYGLDHEDEPVLGVIWDGMGLDTDACIRGSEFYRYHNGRIEWVGSLAPWPHVAGDKMAREARLAAFSLTADLPEAEPLLRPAFSELEWCNYQRLYARSHLSTTSMGRLFDAVGFLLGLPAKATFEGQVPMWLEAMAWRHLRRAGWHFDQGLWPEAHLPQWPVTPLLQRLIALRRSGLETERLAAWFHYSLAYQIGETALQAGTRKVACSGGVFQNRLLVEWLERLWGRSLELFFPERLPPNDEQIAFGQIAWCEMLRRDHFFSTTKSESYVSGHSWKSAFHRHAT